MVIGPARPGNSGHRADDARPYRRVLPAVSPVIEWLGHPSQQGLIAGAKALRAAIEEVFGDDQPVQRCRNHKLDNVMQDGGSQMRLAAIIAFVLGLFPCLPWLAASVKLVQGQASINHGHGYQQLTGAAEANSGDLVMASPGGLASIVYHDGCVVDVYPGAVVAV